MIYPQLNDIGRRVIFRRHPGALPEPGILISLQSGWVMVKYDAGFEPVALRLESLEWEDGATSRSGRTHGPR